MYLSLLIVVPVLSESYLICSPSNAKEAALAKLSISDSIGLFDNKRITRFYQELLRKFLALHK